MSADNDPQLRAFAALQDVRKAEFGVEETRRLIAASQVIAYARRADSTADLTLERVLRRQPGLQALYRQALCRVARASSQRAMAAADAQLARRQVGDYTIELVQELEDMPWLIVHIPDEAAPISTIELCGSDGAGRRLDLGQPIDGVAQLPLDPGFAELAGVAALFQDPATEIYLI